MSLQDKAERLFTFISHVYSIDLPVNRNIRKYASEMWWQADIVPSEFCMVREFDEGNVEDQKEDDEEESPDEGESAWLSVTKRVYDDPPALPPILKDWVKLSKNPEKEPAPRPSIVQTVPFDADEERVAAYLAYRKSFAAWKEDKTRAKPSLPEILEGWVVEGETDEDQINVIDKREFRENFEDNEWRPVAFQEYVETAWKLWAERVMPVYKANRLYDELYALHQRLSVEGDRIEILWGHLFLAWQYSSDVEIYNPLVVTPLHLHFDPSRRTISLIPSQTIPTRIDIDCLANIDYPMADRLIEYVRTMNSSESSIDPWSHNQMRGHASTITAYLSNEGAEKTNRYSEHPCAMPEMHSFPVIYNAPVVFVRERTRRLWVDDAKQVAERVRQESEIPPFIKALVKDHGQTQADDDNPFVGEISFDEDEGEHLLPLLYNDQQEEIVKKLNSHYGVLVQGPPGTGKSHTIANIVCSLLAKGKRVLVTSQTENALRVLRSYIPPEVRSLCVSQLGDDLEAKRQLNEAVDTIGKRLGEKNSSVVEQKTQRIKEDLRKCREEQARLINRIRGWVELDASTIEIGGQTITALQAAKECSDEEERHGWFPDILPAECDPPLSEHELREMCSLLKQIHPDDRRECLKYLPEEQSLWEPGSFARTIARWKEHSELVRETAELRAGWGQLASAGSDMVDEAIALLEKAMDEMNGIESPWQYRMLELMVSSGTQYNYWKDFLEKLRVLREKAWGAYRAMQGFEIEDGGLPENVDVSVALQQLDKIVKKGRRPSSLLCRITLSKDAKIFYEHVKVDGAHLDSQEYVLAARGYFAYRRHLKKIATAWRQTLEEIDGPELDTSSQMPLAEIDRKLKQLELPIQWKDTYHDRILRILGSLGCLDDSHCTGDALSKSLRVLHGRRAEIEKEHIEHNLARYQSFLVAEAEKETSGRLWGMFADAVESRSVESYEGTYNEFLRLKKVCTKVERLEHLAGRLKAVAPQWYGELEKKAVDLGEDALNADWAEAWRWRRLDSWLKALHNRESVESLQDRLERARRRERALILELVTERTWQRQIGNVKDRHFKALTAWADAMRKYGKGKGKYAGKWLAAAARAMIDAVGAVPAWIMPLHRVVQSFESKPGLFDVVIVDEASQCDLRALPVLFRGKKILVVGDPEQISPTVIGIDMSKVFALNRQFLSDIPHADTTFLVDNSLYNITKTLPRMDRTLLTEHFRSVPPIIEFNNRLCPSYAGRLEPLRQPNPQEMLDPPIKTVFVEEGYKDGRDINIPEAEALVDMLVQCCEDERYSRGGKNGGKRTMGVISLLGEKQAKYISDLIAQRLDETEREERRIICGDAYAFQGDERDVMFLSLVIANNARFSPLVRDADRQRFNVATSRARDQVFLFHSVRLEDIGNEQCMRYKLLSWYLDPPLAEMEAGLEVLRQKAQSEFEIEVGERIIRRGYKVIPQYRPFESDAGYVIDLVVQGEDNRVAVECDGDRWHGPDRWEYDQRREAQLRRAGWKFWRISGSAFYRDKDGSLEALWRYLEDEGIYPTYGRRVEQPAASVKERDDSRHNGDGASAEMGTHDSGSSHREESHAEDREQVHHQVADDVLRDPRAWDQLSLWIARTGKIDRSFWGKFPREIALKLRKGEFISENRLNHMRRLWAEAIEKGFNPDRS